MSECEQPRARCGPVGRHATDPVGDLLPERTRDEEADAWGDQSEDQDDRLRREVPPHYG